MIMMIINEKEIMLIKFDDKLLIGIFWKDGSLVISNLLVFRENFNNNIRNV